ncbi:hypothetical protein JCM11641_004244 [Rhodosporidiobolus odoratus]
MTPPSKKQKTTSAATSAKATQPHAEQKEVGGDDLEDNFALDDDFLPDSPASGSEVGDALSDVEAEDGDGAAYDNMDEDSRLPAESAGAPSPAAGGASEGKGKKRSAEAFTGGGGEQGKVAKKAKKDKAKEKKKAKVAEGKGEGEAEMDDTALLPVEAVADRIAEKQRKAMPDLSGLEMDEQRISQSMILDTSSVPLEKRKNLDEFLREALPTATQTLLKLPKARGSPRILVLSSAALRVADLCREVKGFRTKVKAGKKAKEGAEGGGKGKGEEVIEVGKLFAKHFKLAEHVEYLQKTYVGICCCTPSRVEKLIAESEALHLTHLSHLILDTSHLDVKKRSLLDVPEARKEVFAVLGNQGIKERLREGKMKVVLF